MAVMKTKVTVFDGLEKHDYYSGDSIDLLGSRIDDGQLLRLSKYLIESRESEVLLRSDLCPVIELQAIL